MMKLNQEAIDALRAILRDFGYGQLLISETIGEKLVYGPEETRVKVHLVIETDRWEQIE